MDTVGDRLGRDWRSRIADVDWTLGFRSIRIWTVPGMDIAGIGEAREAKTIARRRCAHPFSSTQSLATLNVALEGRSRPFALTCNSRTPKNTDNACRSRWQSSASHVVRTQAWQRYPDCVNQKSAARWHGARCGFCWYPHSSVSWLRDRCDSGRSSSLHDIGAPSRASGCCSDGDLHRWSGTWHPCSTTRRQCPHTATPSDACPGAPIERFPEGEIH